jgi:hypothetical protein
MARVRTAVAMAARRRGSDVIGAFWHRSRQVAVKVQVS